MTSSSCQTTRPRRSPQLEVGACLVVFECDADNSDAAPVIEQLARLFSGFDEAQLGSSNEQALTTVHIGSGSAPGRFTATSRRQDLGESSICYEVDRHAVAIAVTRHLNRLVLDAETDHLHVHAGAVTSDDGTALVLGTSFAGKSTLVAKLVEQGWAYLSDEQVGVTPAGALRPFPRPITLRSGSWQFFDPTLFPLDVEPRPDRVEIAPTDLGHVYRGPSLPADMVICPNVALESFACTTLTAAETLARLLAESFDMERAGEAGIDAMVQVASRAPGYEIAGNDLSRTLATVRSLCAQAEPVGPPSEQTVVPVGEKSSRVRNTRSWLFRDGSAALYEPAEGALVQLDEAGFRAWQMLSDDAATWPDGVADSSFVQQLREIGLLR